MVHCTEANQNNNSRLLYPGQEIVLHDSIVIMRYTVTYSRTRSNKTGGLGVVLPLNRL